MSFQAWRRVPEPKACDFCLMLATRGAVYRTAQTAGDGNSYHRHCRCDAVLETDFDRRTDVYVAPEDANRKIAFYNQKVNRTYQYDLRQYGVKNPPDVPVQAPVRLVPEPVDPVTLEVAKRAQLEGYEKVLEQGGGTAWMRQKVAQLRAELGL